MANQTMLMARLRLSVSVVALTSAITGVTIASEGARAQTGASNQRAFHFNVGAGPLLQALSRYSEITGVQLIYSTGAAKGLSSPGLQGDYTAQAALARLTIGTGLVPRMISASSATLEAPFTVQGAHTLDAVNVQGQQSPTLVPPDGFGLGAGANGSSDATATEGTGSFTTNGTAVASKTAQSLKETAQSVSVLTQARIEQQNLTSVTDAANNLAGVTVEQTNGVYSSYISRGFIIGTYQIDGGAPQAFSLGGAQQSDQNLAEFDNVQIVRGSDGLFGGAGQPGGVISLQRKRPLDHDQLAVDLDIGSWNNYRGVVDVTGPLVSSGALRGRLVVEGQDRDYFYDVSNTKKAMIYGVLEGDLGENTLVRAGSSYEWQYNNGFNAVGLPRYSDGGDLDLSRSTCLCAPWGYLNAKSLEAFGTIEHRFNDAWKYKLDVTGTQRDAVALYPDLQGEINRGAAIGSGEVADEVISLPNLQDKQIAVDTNLNGSFKVFGLKQAVLFGADFTRSTSHIENGYSFIDVPIPSLYSFDPTVLGSRPAAPANAYVDDITNYQYGIYSKIDLQLTKSLHLTGGVAVNNYTYTYVSDVFQNSNFASRWVPIPYGSIRYDLTKWLSIYGSYADIYQSQSSDLDPSGKPLTPVTGVTYEGGIKVALRNGKVNASLSYYHTEESSQAILAEGVLASCVNPLNCYLSTGAYTSKGVDAEISGEVLPRWQLQVSYTFNQNSYGPAYAIYQDSGSFSPQQPRHQIKIWTAYTLPGKLKKLTVGGGYRMESARSTTGSVCSVAVDPVSGACSGEDVPFSFTQKLYSVVDLRLAYQINKHWQAALNLTNLADTRYYSTAGYTNNGNFYGEPRAVMFSIHVIY